MFVFIRTVLPSLGPKRCHHLILRALCIDFLLVPIVYRSGFFDRDRPPQLKSRTRFQFSSPGVISSDANGLRAELAKNAVQPAEKKNRIYVRDCEQFVCSLFLSNLNRWRHSSSLSFSLDRSDLVRLYFLGDICKAEGGGKWGLVQRTQDEKLFCELISHAPGAAAAAAFVFSSSETREDQVH